MQFNLTLNAFCVIIAIMTLQYRFSNRCIGIAKEIIMSHQRLFDDFFHDDSPEIQAIIDQMIHGEPQHKSIKLYEYLLGCFLFAGDVDQSNYSCYAKQRVKPTVNRVKGALQAAQCPKLATFEAFTGCGYQKTKPSCRKPAFLSSCPLPAFDLKLGSLNQMAFSLYFFLRYVAGGDFYTLATQHFGQGQLTDGEISNRLQGFIEKVTTIANVGPKLAYMALSGLFLTRYHGWDYRRVGLHMIAVDSLVHNFLHRTGIPGFYQLDHAYEPRCHTEKGCLGVIQDLAVFRRFDFKVRFDYLKQEQTWLLFKAVVDNMEVSICPSEAGQFKARLAHLHRLTPGDFAVMKRKSQML